MTYFSSTSTRSLKRAFAIALCAGMSASVASFPQALLPQVVTAATPPDYMSKDQVVIAVQSDGTHNGPGTETFLSSAHGYNPGDNTANDGVVASGDVVVYKVDVNIVAGPERRLELEFINASDALNMADFSGLQFSGGIVKQFVENGKIYLDVPRGASGRLSGVVSVRAKDTAGTVVSGNMVTARLKNENIPVFDSKTQEITVISAPLADLTVDSQSYVYRTYTQTDSGGQFSIIPRQLAVPGYSSHGFTASGTWLTDINVSSFPAGTTWSLNAGGTNTPLTVTDGVIKNVTGSGEATLKYVLPDEAKPTESNPTSRYTIELKVSPESFKAGDAQNIPDAGNGQKMMYDTSTYEWNGSRVGALRGALVPNNNFSAATWVYFEAPPGEIWRYDVAAPWDSNKTYFEDSNLYWKSGSGYQQQGYTYPYRRYATSDNDMYNRLTINTSNINEETFSQKLTAIDEIDKVVDDKHQPHSYDTTRKVVVTVNDLLLDLSAYTVEFAGSDGVWYESDFPFEGAVTSRVTFGDWVFFTGPGSYPVKVYWPVKALTTYDPLTDKDDLLHSRAKLEIGETPGVSYDHSGLRDGWWDVHVPLTFMTPPKVTTTIAPMGDATPDGTGAFDTRWTITDVVTTPPTAENYVTQRVLTLDSIYDARTFAFIDDTQDGWVIDKIEGNKVYISNSDYDLFGSGSDRWLGEGFNFTVKTILNPSNDTIAPMQANVVEDLTLSWKQLPGLAAGSSAATSTATQTINVVNELAHIIKAVDNKKEVEDILQWDAKVAAGRVTKAGTQWSQDITLPYNGDISKFDQINKVNDSHIKIDPITGRDTTGAYDKIGRSKFDGSYVIDHITVTDAPPNSQIALKKRDGSVFATLPVGAGGIVDISGVDVRGVEVVSLLGVDNTSDIQSAGANVNIGLKPTGNKEGDDYVMWLEPFSSPALPDKPAVMAWPDNIGIVMSEIEGTLWFDTDRDANLDDSEAGRFAGVAVHVEQLVDGQWMRVPDRAGYTYSTKTDENGMYRFEGLHSGEYRVKLSNVEKDRTDTADLDMVAGGVSVDSQDGTLTYSVVNRFGVEDVVDMTRSYKQVFNNTNDTVSVTVVKDSTTRKVDFGFYTQMADLAVDKSRAKIESASNVFGASDMQRVMWDVEVKNTGDTVLKGAVLNDRTSSEVLGVTASAGYLGAFGITGSNPVVSGMSPISDDEGYVVATSDGVWVGNGTNTPTKIEGFTGSNPVVVGDRPMYRQYGYAVTTSDGVWVGGDVDVPTKIEGFTGSNPVVVGDRPMSSTGGYTITTSDGVWVGFGTDTLTKIEGFTGSNPVVVGRYPMGGEDGYIVTTSDGVWICVGVNVVKKIEGITGSNPVAASVRPMIGGYIITTSDGAWLGRGFSLYNPHKIRNITGDNFVATGSSPDGFPSSNGYVITTSEGIWFGSDYHNAKKIEGITGSNPVVVGGAPLNMYGYAITTSDGIWVGGGWELSANPTKIEGVTGSNLVVTGHSPMYRQYGYAVTTSDGVWVGGDVDTPTKIEGFTGSNPVVTGATPVMGGYMITTSDGVWVGSGEHMWGLSSDGVYTDYGIEPPTKIGGTRYVVDHNLAESRDSFSETNSQQRSFVNRGYNLPDILPGETVIVRLTGTVRQRDAELVVANQAYVTSPETPREGITQVSVTGTGMQPGVPDLPIIPDVDKVNRDGIEGNPTVGTNASVDKENSRSVDDLADQTPAIIPALPGQVLDASISGVAWYDTDKDGLRSDTEERVVGMKVVAENIDGVIIGQTVTDEKGEWFFTDLKDGERVNIQYEVVGHEHNGKKWTPVVADDSDTADDSDIDITGSGVRYFDSVARIGGNSGVADAGLQAIDSGISVVKAGRKGDENLTVRGEVPLTDEPLGSSVLLNNWPRYADLDIDSTTGGFDDRDDDPRTNAYTYTITNTGQNDLTNIVISDATMSGLAGRLGTFAFFSADVEGSNRIFYQLADNGGGTFKLIRTLPTTEPMVLKAGQSVVLTFAVDFTIGNELHANTLTATADVVSDDGTVIDRISDSDNFSVKYEQVQPKRLKLLKVADTGRDTEREAPLRGTSVKIERTSFASLLQAESVTKNGRGDIGGFVSGEVGNFVTNKDGEISTELSSGVYRITETKASAGYLTPQTVTHYVKVEYDAAGNPQLESITVQWGNESDPSFSTDRLVEMHVEQAADSTSWGTVELDNVEDMEVPVRFGLPATGLASLAITGVMSLLLLGGYALWTLRGGGYGRRGNESGDTL